MSDKKYKTFTDYYNEDEEFRKKHLARLNEKVTCECGFVTARCNLSRHKKSHLHTDKMVNIDRINKIKEEMNQLKNELKILEKKVNINNEK